MTPEPKYLELIAQILQDATPWSFLGILLFAGVSIALGRSVLLLANQIRPWRLILSFIVEVSRFLMASLVWIYTPYYYAKLILGYDFNIEILVTTVAIAFSPLVSAWWGLLPYFGRGILRLQYFSSFFLLFILYLVLGFHNNVFLILPIGFILTLGFNVLVLNPLESFAAGRKLVFDFKRLRS